MNHDELQYRAFLAKVTMQRHPMSMQSLAEARTRDDWNKRYRDMLDGMGDYQAVPYRWYHRLADRYWHDPIARFRVRLADRICPFDRDGISGGNI
jgi:hypothetical protein